MSSKQHGSLHGRAHSVLIPCREWPLLEDVDFAWSSEDLCLCQSEAFLCKRLHFKNPSRPASLISVQTQPLELVENWGLPKLGVYTFWGVPRKRIVVFWGLYWGYRYPYFTKLLQ